MVNPIYLLLTLVSVAGFVMLCVNLYVLLKQSKNKRPEEAMLLHQRLDSLSQLVNDQLKHGRESTDRATLSVQQKMDSLAHLLANQLNESRESTQKATLAVHQQVQGFTQGMTQLQDVVKQVHESVKGVSSFQDIFKAPKLRGTWGEASLEAALNQYFPRERYEMQHYFKSGEAVDAILKLPNNIILPIDSKFNWENFEKMVNAETEINKDMYRKQFLSDVKKKVDEISSKYILPSEGTTDFALMYIPAETVYYEIINQIKEADIPSYARSKKVVLISPNTFMLSISSISHWFRDVQITKQTQEIIKRLGRIVTDSGKLSDSFEKLGKHLSNAQSSFEDSEKRLSLMTDRINSVVEIGEVEEVKKIAAVGEPRQGREAPEV